MHLPLRWIWIALAAAVLASFGAAQEVDLAGGTTLSSGLRRGSYAYQVDYHQDFGSYFSLVESWINEGHLTNHHRDGAATEAWLNLPFHPDNLTLSAGVGFYTYFDTTGIGANVEDLHGTAPIFAFAVTGDLPGRWFWRAQYQRIEPHGDSHNNTATVGLGVWLGHGTRTQPQRDDNYVTEQEITAYGGESVVNSFSHEKGIAWAAEYRTGILPHFDWSLTWINEGDPRVVRRNGLATQIWPVNAFFNDRLEVGLGVGAYGYIDRKHQSTGVMLPILHSKAALGGLLSPTIAYRLDSHWILRATFNRVVSNYNRDADVMLLGLGYRFGRHFDLR